MVGLKVWIRAYDHIPGLDQDVSPQRNDVEALHGYVDSGYRLSITSHVSAAAACCSAARKCAMSLVDSYRSR